MKRSGRPKEIVMPEMVHERHYMKLDYRVMKVNALKYSVISLDYSIYLPDFSP